MLLSIKIKIKKWLDKRFLSKFKSYGNNVTIIGSIDVMSPQNISVGNNCTFNHRAYINAFNPVTIGNGVTLSAGAKIISTGYDLIEWQKGKKEHIVNDGIVIGNNVWIGANAMILSGVKITGEFVVIAAGAVVTKNIEDSHCIYAGCPAVKLKDLPQ